MRSVLLGVLVALAVVGTPAPASAQGGPCALKLGEPPLYARWSGPWAKHGASLDVYPEGCGILTWRTYEWCRPGQLVGCDRIHNGVIEPGGFAWFVLDTRHAASASGQTLITPGPQIDEPGGIVFTLNDDGTMTVERHGAAQTFCRPWAWITERCGA